MTNERRRSVWAISDADEPGDAILTGMRHRDYDGVMLVLVPDVEGWLDGESAESPVRPLLLFYRGAEPALDKAQAWLAKHEEDASCFVTAPSPDTLEDWGAREATRTVTVHLNYPPYPWLDEARLGMQMGRYFSDVELVDWSDATDDHPGVYRYRFTRPPKESDATGAAGAQLSVDDLPF
ncbi:MAG: hypothetical protein ACYCYO_15065 [Bacilli bacterium]